RPLYFTLFPYTTLFRSDIPLIGNLLNVLNGLIDDVLGSITNLSEDVVELLDDIANGTLQLTNELAAVQVLGQTTVEVNGVKVAADRKSTRLNSSHVSSS